MLYESTAHNMWLLVRTMGYLRKEQIMQFFSDVDDRNNLDFYLEKLIKDRIFDLSEDQQFVSFHTTPKIKTPEIKNRIRAFYIPATFKSKRVREISLMSYPAVLEFVTYENEVYDVSVITCRSDAQIGREHRIKLLVKTVDTNEPIDDVVHVAIVPNAAVGKEIAPFDYDSFCLLDKTGTPNYYTWD